MLGEGTSKEYRIRSIETMAKIGCGLEFNLREPGFVGHGCTGL